MPEPGVLSLAAPPDISVPCRAGQRRGAKPDQRDPPTVEHRHVAHHLPGQPMPQPVMRVQLSVEPADLVPSDRPDP